MKAEDLNWFDDFNDEAHTALGKTVNAWSQVERAVWSLTNDLLASEPHLGSALASGWRGFDKRSKLLLALVKDRLPEHADSLDKLLDDARKLRNKRDLIAHAPMLPWINQDGELQAHMHSARTAEPLE